MTTVHAQLVGDKAIVSRTEFEQLVVLARKSDEIDLQTQEEDLPTLGVMRLAERGGRLTGLADEADLYTVNDLRVRYR